MTHPRMAFAAEYWGRRPVLCRAVEGSTGCSIIQEFGFFATWTEARSLADRLNEGLGLSPTEAREIVTGARLAVSHLQRIANWQSFFRERAPVMVKARALQSRCISSQLQLARTYCHLWRCGPRDASSELRLEKAKRALEFALDSLPRMFLTRSEAAELALLIGRVKAELAGIAAAVDS